MTSIKPDPGQPLESKIKPDPDSIGNSPAPQTDEDIYEDTGDLDFAGSDQGFYLTRLPKFLWDSWSKLDDNQEIQIGTIRVEGGLNDVKRVSTFFHSIQAAYFPLRFLLFCLSFADHQAVDESYALATHCTKPGHEEP